ncbi:hypothetical protein KR96_13760 [Ralstonia solanacearum]|nr:hypothetical protein KR96_13760 [Ralstonia solanacearum]KFX83649.1 hypothetical protein KR99_10920 [Ralstonia solanacearum]
MEVSGKQEKQRCSICDAQSAEAGAPPSAPSSVDSGAATCSSGRRLAAVPQRAWVVAASGIGSAPATAPAR